jgi:peptide/nickel transport system substrate-binding protein
MVSSYTSRWSKYINPRPCPGLWLRTRLRKRTRHVKKAILLALSLLFAASLCDSFGQTPPISPQKILRVCDSGRDSTFRLDPHVQFEPRNRNIINQIFERLVEFDVDGNPSPGIAKSWKRLDQQTVQFKLNKGIFFHNGEPCDADAVKFSLQRNARLNSPSYQVLKSIKRVDVLDSHTLNIVTRYPDGIIINRLCEAFVVPPHYVAKMGDKEFEKHPIGTGPYKFIKWAQGKELVLEKNTKYWRSGLPRLDRIIFKFVDSRKRVEMLLAGELDFITNFEPGDLQRLEKQGFKTMKEPSFAMMSIYFNLRKPSNPFLSKAARKAANYAVNKDELIKKVKLGHGIARGTLGMPGELGYNPHISPYPYEPEKAKELLRQAGYPDGFGATILVDDIDGGAEGVFARELTNQLASVGIRLRVDAADLAARLTGPKFDGKVQVLDFDMIARTIPPPLGHVIFLEGILSYDSESPWSLLNSPKFDQLYNRIIRTLDLSQQAKLCHKLEEFLHEECYSLFAYQEIMLYAMRKGVMYDPYITGVLSFRETDIR